DGGDAGGGHRRRMRGGEQERPRAVVEELNEIAGAADVASERADGLGERAYLYIHAAVDAEVVDGAAAVAPQHARGVCIIHHHDGAVLFGRSAESGER